MFPSDYLCSFTCFSFFRIFSDIYICVSLFTDVVVPLAFIHIALCTFSLSQQVLAAADLPLMQVVLGRVLHVQV